MTNLASDVNAKIINQRFKELEAEILELKEAMTVLENTVGNMQNLINAQTQMIQNVWVQDKGTGGTENE